MMKRAKFKSLFVAATVFACLYQTTAAQQSSSTDIFKATSPSIDELDPSLIESELIEGTASEPVVESLDIDTDSKPQQENTFNPSPAVSDDFNIPNSNSFLNSNKNQKSNPTTGSNSGIAKPGFNQPPISGNEFTPPSLNEFNTPSSTLKVPPTQSTFQPQGIGRTVPQRALTSLPVNDGTMMETRIAPTIQTQIMSPKSININQPAQIYIQATNTGHMNVKAVKLIATLPEHAKFQSSNPLPTNVDGQIHEFTLNNLGANSKQIVKLNLVPTSKLPLNISTQVMIEQQQQFSVSVQQPVLDVEVNGPQAIQTGQTAKHTVTVKNIGDGDAENIRIKPILPDNLQLASNQKTLVPKLVPGQTAKFILSSYARSSGNSDVVFQVSATGIVSRESRSHLKIIRPEIGVQLLGPSQNFLGREGVYSIQLENSSELPVNSVEIALQVPAGLKVNTISQQAKIDNVSGTLNWKFEKLAGNQQQVIQFKAEAIKPGNQTFDVVVTSSEIGSKQLALTTNVQGRADLSVRLSDGGEPVSIGSKSEFTIEVSNHGSTTANQVNVQIQLPEALMAVSQENYTLDPSGNFIQFNGIDIAPGKTRTLRFKVVAVSIGEHVVRGSVSIDGSRQTISTENSIFVFEAKNAKISEALTPDIR